MGRRKENKNTKTTLICLFLFCFFLRLFAFVSNEASKSLASSCDYDLSQTLDFFGVNCASRSREGFSPYFARGEARDGAPTNQQSVSATWEARTVSTNLCFACCSLNRQTDGQTDTQTDGHAHRQTHKLTRIQFNSQDTHRQTHKPNHRRTHGQTHKVTHM